MAVTVLVVRTVADAVTFARRRVFSRDNGSRKGVKRA
jgi:hypothetical protein